MLPPTFREIGQLSYDLFSRNSFPKWSPRVGIDRGSLGMSLTTQGILFLRPQANLLGGKQEDSPGLLKAWNPHTCVQGARISPQNKPKTEAQPCRRGLIGVRLQNKTPPWPPPSPQKKTLENFFFPRAAFCPSAPLPPRNLEEKSHRALLGSSKDF